jgi:hypothetical protein
LIEAIGPVPNDRRDKRIKRKEHSISLDFMTAARRDIGFDDQRLHQSPAKCCAGVIKTGLVAAIYLTD